MRIEVVTLFPEMLHAALGFGVVGRALERGIAQIGTEDPRAYTQDVHRTVDDRPYGGGPGMVLKPEPLLAAVRAASARLPAGSPRIYLSAQGMPFDQRQAQRLAGLPGMLLLAGRYEGIDERVIALGVDEELSIGDYVLSGGELPALVVIDAVVRLMPGALGCERSSVEESFAQGLLEGPQYTRPEVFEGLSVPAVLRSGNHAEVSRWRYRQALERTWVRRPDWIVKQTLAPEASRLLDEFVMARAAGARPAEGNRHEQDHSRNREATDDPEDPGLQAG